MSFDWNVSKMSMTKARIDGLSLLFLGATVVLLLMAYLLGAASPAAFQDFKSDYFASRCLIEHRDPYRESDVLRHYLTEGGAKSAETELDRQIASRYVYPPTAFALMIPFALMPWGLSHVLWMVLSTGCLLLASYLTWDLGAKFAPVLCGAMAGFLLANSEVITVLCNPSGIVISLCVIAVWCFVRDRWIVAGVVGLALALAVKPQNAGFIWLYFTLAGGVFRRRAVQSLLVLIAIGLPCVVWASHVAPQWPQELHANLLAFSAYGGLNDPGPASSNAHDLIDLPVIVSYLRDDPHIYNTISYLIFAPFLIFWIFCTSRARRSPRNVWLALAAIAPLSLLPVHHHLYDTKLLLLTIPACAMLVAEGRRTGQFALAVNSVVFALTGDISSTLISHLVYSLPFAEPTRRAIEVFLVPLSLLAMGTFYLWIYALSSLRPMGNRVSTVDTLAASSAAS